MERDQLHRGMVAYAADGQKLGKVIDISGDTLLVEKGFFFPKDYSITLSEISDVRGEEIHLRQSASSLEEAGSRKQQMPAARAGAAIPAQPSAGDVRVPLAEEELEAKKRVREAGAVNVTKRVVTEQKEVTVPVMHEEVEVERVASTPGAEASEASFQDETLRIPIREEEVEVTKRPVVKGEVRIHREQIPEERRVEGSVRKEEVEVEHEGDVVRSGEPPDIEPKTRT